MKKVREVIVPFSNKISKIKELYNSSIKNLNLLEKSYNEKREKIILNNLSKIKVELLELELSIYQNRNLSSYEEKVAISVIKNCYNEVDRMLDTLANLYIRNLSKESNSTNYSN